MKAIKVSEISFKFSKLVVEAFKHLQSEDQEVFMSKKLLKSGTKIGVFVIKAEKANNEEAFNFYKIKAKDKMSEAKYWLMLLHETKYLRGPNFSELYERAMQLSNLISMFLNFKENSEVKTTE